MSSYTIELEDNNILRIEFGEPASNDQIIRDADVRINELLQSEKFHGGKLLKVNGPASMPVAMLLGHRLTHLYETVACFDPKLGCYVVVSCHGGQYGLGDLLN
jgi:CRISPR-associated protein Csx3